MHPTTFGGLALPISTVTGHSPASGQAQAIRSNGKAGISSGSGAVLPTTMWGLARLHCHRSVPQPQAKYKPSDRMARLKSVQVQRRCTQQRCGRLALHISTAPQPWCAQHQAHTARTLCASLVLLPLSCMPSLVCVPSHCGPGPPTPPVRHCSSTSHVSLACCATAVSTPCAPAACVRHCRPAGPRT